jgi:predicted amidophosphoribosyltransferase
MDCPKCKAPVSVRAKFCDQCGANLATNVEFLHQRALDHYHRGLIDESIRLWDEAIGLEPGYSKGYYYRAGALRPR